MEGRGSDSQREWFYYGECQKNHATHFGTTATDGCGEFLPDDNLPDSLLCTVCGCHRNYHRKTLYIDSDDDDGDNQQTLQAAPPVELLTAASATPSNDGDRGEQQQQQQQMVATDVATPVSPNVAAAVSEPLPVAPREQLEELDARRRPRTTFTDYQKERMRLYAEDLGWKMVRHRSEEINFFCNEIGVSRQSFKVWMHNHKNTSSSSALASMVPSEPDFDGSRDNNDASSSRFHE
ncbi:hypothetical protein NE237_020504 [Protea cynaroides]|uniref:ZF-HD dimerization-type domain-containing protein n=1 Tax=Protea cynaroides TaxID=273540 RepID=A0A9Q0HBB8_9MAGN|nr:hypothetical protein NE237_020504 [Protea cynaroides]